MNYEFIEWYKLGLDIRADLLTVAEGLRPGANIDLTAVEGRQTRKFLEKQKKLLEFCLKALDLKFRAAGWDYYVSKSESVLSDLWSERLTIGQFLGYPKCCVDEFEVGCIEYMESMEHGNTDVNLAPGVRYYRELEQVLNRDDFNSALLYNQHIPCKINCIESLKIAEKNREVLERVDFEAAKHLRDYNHNAVYEFYYRRLQGGGE